MGYEWPTAPLLYTYRNGSYAETFPGSSGGATDPEGYPKLVGTHHRNAGFVTPVGYHATGIHEGAARNAYSQDPAGGLAASLPPVPFEDRSTLSSDKPHNSVLDGHQASAVSSHPDGRFAMNTAATSDHSRHANYETFRGILTGWNRTEGDPGRAHQTPIANPLARTVFASTSQLVGQRSTRLHGQPELLVKDAAPGRWSPLSVLGRPMTGTELGLGAFGLYAAYSLVR
jgi:hypothetical protein